MVCPSLSPVEHRFRHAPFIVDTHSPLTFTRQELVQRQTDDAFGITPPTADQDEITLVELSVSQLFVQRDQRRPLLRQEKHARRVPIEPTREFEKPVFA